VQYVHSAVHLVQPLPNYFGLLLCQVCIIFRQATCFVSCRDSCSIWRQTTVPSIWMHSAINLQDKVRPTDARPSTQYNGRCKLHPSQGQAETQSGGFERQLIASLMLLIYCPAILV